MSVTHKINASINIIIIIAVIIFRLVFSSSSSLTSSSPGLLKRKGAEAPATSFPVSLSNMAAGSRGRYSRATDRREFVAKHKADEYLFPAQDRTSDISLLFHQTTTTSHVMTANLTIAHHTDNSATFVTSCEAAATAATAATVADSTGRQEYSVMIAKILNKSSGDFFQELDGNDSSHRKPKQVITFHAFEITLCIVLPFFITLVVIGNAYVILAVCVFEKMRTLSNGLIVSLATADFMVAMTVMPISMHRELTRGLWTLGVAICNFWLTADVFCCTASILNIAVIALDRYWLITRNVKYTHSDRFPRRRMCLLMLTSAWLTALFISCAPLLGWWEGSENNDPTECMISQDYAYTLFSTVGAFWLPLGVILVVYSRVFTFARQRAIRRRQKHYPEKTHKCSSSPKYVLDPKSLFTNRSNGVMAVAIAITRKLSAPVNHHRKPSKAETSGSHHEDSRKFSLAIQVENHAVNTPFLTEQEPIDEEATKEVSPTKTKRSFFSVSFAASRLLRLHRRRQELKNERRHTEVSSSFSRDDDFSDFRSRAEISQDQTSDCCCRNGDVFIEADIYDESADDVLSIVRNADKISHHGEEQSEETEFNGKVRQVCIVPSKRLLLTPTAYDREQQSLTRSKSRRRSKKDQHQKTAHYQEVQNSPDRPVGRKISRSPLRMLTPMKCMTSSRSQRASSLTVEATAKNLRVAHDNLKCANSQPILKNQPKSNKIDTPGSKDDRKSFAKSSSATLFHSFRSVGKPPPKTNAGLIGESSNLVSFRPKTRSCPECAPKVIYVPDSNEISKSKPPLFSSLQDAKQRTRKESEIAISIVAPDGMEGWKDPDNTTPAGESGEKLINSETYALFDSTESSDDHHVGGRVRISEDGCPLSSSTVVSGSTSPGIESDDHKISSERKRHLPTERQRSFRRKYSQRTAAPITTTTSDLIKIRQSRRMRKSARTLGLIIGGFLICWLPFFCLATIVPFCPEVCEVPHVVSSLALWLGYFNSLLNPIIYAIWDDNFRKAFKRLSRCDIK